MSTKRSLLQKYDIPINHLDFEYIRKCENAKELERIVSILKSGEEGYYPDLTKCAVDKLKQLNPNSKVLREERPVLTKCQLNSNDWNELSNDVESWSKTIKEKESTLRSAGCDNELIYSENLPPIRQQRKIDNEKRKSEKPSRTADKIRSCDYDQWDKYDPDTEILKMDLNEEKMAIKNQKNIKKSLIQETVNLNHNMVIDGLTDIEREQLAEKHRQNGNEFFKTSEYHDAIFEYTKSIRIQPTAAAFNNRAMCHLKLSKYSDVISDTNECLKIDATNIKALLRNGLALEKNGSFRNAHEMYSKVLKIDVTNKYAQQKIDNLKLILPDMPPSNAFRMKIEECENSEEINSNSTVSQDILAKNGEQNNIQEKRPNSTKLNPIVNEKPIEKKNVLNKKNKVMQEDVDFSALIIPNKIVKSKLCKMNETLGDIQKEKEVNRKKSVDRVKQMMEKKAKPVTLSPSAVKKRTEYYNGVIIEEL